MSAPETQKQAAIDTHSSQAQEFVAGYHELAQDPFGSCFTYSRRRLEDWLLRLLPAPAPASPRQLLDVGCGTGHHLVHLRERGFEVAGVDGSEKMLAQARVANPGIDLRVSDVESLPFEDGRFDDVLSIEVLRYLPDPLPCLREMARVLRPGGRCVLTAMPLLNLNGYYLVNRLAARAPVAGLVPLRQFFTTSRRLRAQLASAGFVDVEVHGVYVGPVNWLERLAKPLLAPALRRWEKLDAALSDRAWLRDFSNMFVVRATRKDGR